jgi:hypothetical protein
VEKNVDLPCGLELPGGKLVRSAVIRKLKGQGQIDAASLASKKNPDNSEVMQAVLTPSVVRIGDKSCSSTIFQDMLIADTDALLFEVVRLTAGDRVTVKDVCPDCPKGEGATEIRDFDLSALQVDGLDDAEGKWWLDGRILTPEDVTKLAPEERENVRCRVFTLTNEELGVQSVFRYPRGRDRKAIGKMSGNLFEATWKLMSLTAMRWHDPEHDVEKIPPGGLHGRFWSDVDADILNWLYEAWSDAQPGVESRFDAECPNGHEFTATASAMDFLFRVPNRRRRSKTR